VRIRSTAPAQEQKTFRVSLNRIEDPLASIAEQA
jgi:hypothetical protein